MQNKIAVRHLIFSTAFGHAAVIYREDPFSLIETLLPRASRKSLFEAFGKDEMGKAGSHENARAVSESILGYFEGKQLHIPWEWMDMNRLTPLQKSVLKAVAAIPYGKMGSYKEIAENISSPRAARFVGNTVAKNPFPILIPCHRVVRSDGSIGKFGGGPELKRKMIELEAKYAEIL